MSGTIIIARHEESLSNALRKELELHQEFQAAKEYVKKIGIYQILPTK